MKTLHALANKTGRKYSVITPFNSGSKHWNILVSTWDASVYPPKTVERFYGTSYAKTERKAIKFLKQVVKESRG